MSKMLPKLEALCVKMTKMKELRVIVTNPIISLNIS